VSQPPAPRRPCTLVTLYLGNGLARSLPVHVHSVPLQESPYRNAWQALFRVVGEGRGGDSAIGGILFVQSFGLPLLGLLLNRGGRRLDVGGEPLQAVEETLAGGGAAGHDEPDLVLEFG